MLEKVRDDYGLERPPGEVLADGLMGTGANLRACEEREITLYSPVEPGKDAVVVRADPSQPVPDSERNKLPTRAAGKTRLLDKSSLYTTPGINVFGARKASGCRRPRCGRGHGRENRREVRAVGRLRVERCLQRPRIDGRSEDGGFQADDRHLDVGSALRLSRRRAADDRPGSRTREARSVRFLL